MRYLIIFTTIIILVVSVAAFASASERTPPGSYLVYRATTVSQLRSEAAKNSVVRARYTKHFGVSPDKLDKFFADNLTLTSLKQPLRVQSWYINKKGVISVNTKLLPRGTMVFATKSGEPLLAWSCGNPLRADLPTKMVKAETDKIKTPLDVETKVLANPVETISTAVVTAPPAPAVVSMLPVETPPVLASISAPAVSMPPLMALSSSFGAGWLGALGGLGGIAGSIHAHTTRTVTTPEPSSLIAIGCWLCLTPVAWRVRRRQIAD